MPIPYKQGMTREQALELVRGLLTAYAECERSDESSEDQALLNYAEKVAAIIDALTTASTGLLPPGDLNGGQVIDFRVEPQEAGEDDGR